MHWDYVWVIYYWQLLLTSSQSDSSTLLAGLRQPFPKVVAGALGDHQSSISLPGSKWANRGSMCLWNIHHVIKHTMQCNARQRMSSIVPPLGWPWAICRMRKVICGIENAEWCWLAKWASNPNPKPFRNFQFHKLLTAIRKLPWAHSAVCTSKKIKHSVHTHG